MKVTNDPVEGCDRANWVSVLPSRAMATAAAMMVSGEATPAVAAISANPEEEAHRRSDVGHRRGGDVEVRQDPAGKTLGLAALPGGSRGWCVGLADRHGALLSIYGSTNSACCLVNPALTAAIWFGDPTRAS